MKRLQALQFVAILAIPRPNSFHRARTAKGGRREVGEYKGERYEEIRDPTTWTFSPTGAVTPAN